MVIALTLGVTIDLHLDNVLISFDPALKTIQDIFQRDGIVLDRTDRYFYEYKPENRFSPYTKQPSETVRVQVSHALSFTTGYEVRFKDIHIKIADFGLG